MNEDQAGRQVRSVFENEFQPASAGFEARLRTSLERAPARKAKPRWPVEVAAAILALLVISVLALSRLVPNSSHGPATGLQPTPASVKPILVGSRWAVQVTGTSVAWLFGSDVVFRSADQGSHWVDVSPERVSGQPSPVGVGQPLTAFALDKNRAWLAAPSAVSGQLLRSVTFYGTADAGSSWQKLGMAPITGSFVHQMTFIDPTHGWLLVSLGAATGSEAVSIWGTSDGGVSWSELAKSPVPQQNPAPGQLSSGCDKSGITFNTETTGWLTAICANGEPSVYRTLDGGHTWNVQALQAPSSQTQENRGYSPDVEPPTFLSQSFGLLPVVLSLGSQNTRSMVVYTTHDGGRSWNPSAPVAGGTLAAAVRPDYWVVAIPPSQIATTQDGQRYSLISSNADLSQTQQLAFEDEQTGLALTVRSSGGYELLRTTDGGARWSPISFGPDAAIAAAGDYGLGAGGSWPYKPGRMPCVLYGGGPYPGLKVPGICATAASSDSADGGWTVTFTESWDARQFHGGGDPGTGQLSHSWTYAVGSAGQVSLTSQSGNFPPQEVI